MTESAPINVISALAVREACLELFPQFEAASGHPINVTWTGTGDIRKRMASGETCDLVITSSDGLAELLKAAVVMLGTVTPLVTCGMGAAVRAGAPVPDIGTVQGLRDALVAAESVGRSSGPSGLHLERVCEDLGIGEQVAAKTRIIPSGQTVATQLASGEVDLGFQQVPELLHDEAITFVGPLPPGVQNTTIFSAGIHRAAQEPEAAKALLAFLGSADTVAIFRHHGLEPAHGA